VGMFHDVLLNDLGVEISLLRTLNHFSVLAERERWSAPLLAVCPPGLDVTLPSSRTFTVSVNETRCGGFARLPLGSLGADVPQMINRRVFWVGHKW
jgi:hypothetical protein